jgi:hypothetical protein
MDLFIGRCFTLGNGWGVGHLCPLPRVDRGSLFQNALLLSGYLLASETPLAFNPLQYVFSQENRNKEVLPNSSPNNYVLIFKGDYHSLGPVSTLTKWIIIFFKKWIHLKNLKLYIFSSSIIILWYE